MLSFEDIIKYVGLAVVFYFLIRAFTNDKLTNTQIIVIVICIMALVIFVATKNFNCPKKEKFSGNKIPEIKPNNLPNLLNDSDFFNEDDIKEMKSIIENREKEKQKDNNYGYTYMPPETWFSAYNRVPVCITDKKCAVCPVSDPYICGLMEFEPEGVNQLV